MRVIQLDVHLVSISELWLIVIVAVDSDSPAYDRNRFKTWDISEEQILLIWADNIEFLLIWWIVSGTCDTRESE